MSNARSPRSLCSMTVGIMSRWGSRMEGPPSGIMQLPGCRSWYPGPANVATDGLHIRKRERMMPFEHQVRREIFLPASRVEVWEALTDPARLSAWFGAEVSLE